MPEERIAARIRRARLRRVAGVGLLAAVVAAGVVTGMNLTHGHPSEPATSPSGPGFTAADGAVYRQLDVISMTRPTQRSVALTLTPGQEPLDVMSHCSSPGSAFVRVEVNGAAVGQFACAARSQLIGLPVRPGVKARITFVRLSGGNEPNKNAVWQFTVYAWTPPATTRSAPAIPQLPVSYTGPDMATGHGTAVRRLIDSRGGDWPAQRTATLTLTFHSLSLDISMFCAGPIAGRLQLSLAVDGAPGQAMSCPSWVPAAQAQDSTSVSGTPGQQVTLTFRIQGPGYAAADYARRAASWIVGIYQEGS